MKLKQAESHKGAALNVASNSNLNRSGLFVLKGKQYEITKTLIYYFRGGLVKVYYINKNGELVYDTGGGLREDVMVIGEVEETTEMPEIIYPWDSDK